MCRKSRPIDLDEVIALSQIPIRTLETIAPEMKFQLLCTAHAELIELSTQKIHLN